MAVLTSVGSFTLVGFTHADLAPHGTGLPEAAALAGGAALADDTAK